MAVQFDTRIGNIVDHPFHAGLSFFTIGLHNDIRHIVDGDIIIIVGIAPAVEVLSGSGRCLTVGVFVLAIAEMNGKNSVAVTIGIFSAIIANYVSVTVHIHLTSVATVHLALYLHVGSHVGGRPHIAGKVHINAGIPPAVSFEFFFTVGISLTSSQSCLFVLQLPEIETIGTIATSRKIAVIIQRGISIMLFLGVFRHTVGGIGIVTRPAGFTTRIPLIGIGPQRHIEDTIARRDNGDVRSGSQIEVDMSHQAA